MPRSGSSLAMAGEVPPFWHRWELVATPADDSPIATALAKQWNKERRRFTFRRSAAHAVWFYEQRLCLPVRFWIRRIGEDSW